MASAFSNAQDIPVSNVIPTYAQTPFTTLGIMATSPATKQARAGTMSTSNNAPTELDKAHAIGISGHPVPWWIAILVLLVGLMWFAQNMAKGETSYGNIKGTLYNVIVITLAAVIGITTLKRVLTKWPVPGLTTVIMAT